MLVRCRVPGCSRRHEEDLAMCGPDWKRLPAGLRSEVWAASRRYGYAGTPEHLALLERAWAAAADSREGSHA